MTVLVKAIYLLLFLWVQKTIICLENDPNNKKFLSPLLRRISAHELLQPLDHQLNSLSCFQNSEALTLIRDSVTEKCSIQIDWFFENLGNYSSDEGMWALKMLDATTKIPSGIMTLNLGDWMGSFDQCLGIISEKRGIKGNYCLATLYINIDYPLHFISESLRRSSMLFAEKKSNFQTAFPTASYPSLGFCIPDGCTQNDLDRVVYALNLTFPVRFDCQTYEDANPPLTGKAWCVISFFLVTLTLMTVSTAYDFYCQENQKERHQLLIAFSIYTNGQKLFHSSNNGTELSCLHGIRVLSMLWVIVGHTFSLIVSGPLVNGLDALKYLDKPESMIFAKATFSVDTFLMVTGLLVVYGYIKGRHMGTKFNWFQFYIHRYVRLTPPFLAVALVSMSLLQYMGSGPHWSFIVNYFQDYCEKNWWSSLMYLQNYIDVTSWCVGQTWYLNIDWQLYVIAPLFLLPLALNPKAGILLLVSAIIICIALPFYVTWVNELPAVITNLNGDLTNYQHMYYLRTHTRAAPWFVGGLFGYFIAKIKLGAIGKIEFNKTLMLISWCVTLAVLLILIFLGYDSLRAQEYHKWENALFNALARPAWAACIGWISFCCINGYGGIINSFLSLKIFQILNRFTYSIYLLHVTMIYMITYARKRPCYFSIFNVVYSFWSITMVTFVLAIFWVLAFESPVIVIEKYLSSRASKAASKANVHQTET